MNHGYMLDFQQFAFAHANQYSVDDHAGEQWCFEQGSSSKRDLRDKKQLQKNLVKVRNEWRKVKEEIGHAKQRGQHLSEAILETGRKVEVMLVELERAEKDVRDLMAQKDRLL
ncbi:hypothetical protein Cni_G16242 [Canna indica]|uniref:Uncharacterized protein n=1 Tax=Canna indica TaxID=4628 RepID=A0AAQ3QGK8_9LILI|nr:hypothetical protein Cni_G16242 [Canna indica]